ncbi:hypothetical protein FV219_01065 [Methylobacterium sp. WL122]|jgi:hypothetical protein|nr:hypothetical protein FV219_01065 [Methylobacterium sp. WL122]
MTATPSIRRLSVNGSSDAAVGAARLTAALVNDATYVLMTDGPLIAGRALLRPTTTQGWPRCRARSLIEINLGFRGGPTLAARVARSIINNSGDA